MLHVLNIRKRFGAVTALKDASLCLAPGEIRALLGANGSGKSTLVKILGGMLGSDKGQILYNSVPLKIKDSRDARHHGIAVAYQDLSLVPKFSVANNILLGQEPRGRLGFVQASKIRRRAIEVMERLNVNLNPDVRVEDLDPAMQNLIEVAKAMAWEPRILVLDEVTASLHHDQVKSLFSLLREMRDRGLAILFVSHRFDEVFSLCNTATILRGGETIADVDIGRVTESDLVYHMTGKRPEKYLAGEHAAENEERKDSVLSLSAIEVQPKVKGVNLEVRSGQIIGLAGLQDQGQAELLRSIYGMIPLTSGQMEYFGVPVILRSPRVAMSLGIGFISGDREREGILPARPVMENLFLAKLALRRFFGILNLRALQEEAATLVAQLKIVAGSIEHPANSLSGGNQQKLIVGRWLMVNPKLLLLDDPTKGVDISARREIHDLLRQMADRGTAVIISSSDNSELLEIVDRIFVFYEGKIVAELSGNEKNEERLVSAMLGMEGSGKGGVSK